MAPFDPENFIDKTPDYWSKPENARFWNQLSTFERARITGQLRHEQLVRPYATPRSMMVQLKESPGGLPKWGGQDRTLAATNYQGPGIMGLPQNAPNPALAAGSIDREINPAEMHQAMMSRMTQQGASPAQMVQGGIVNSPPQGAGGPRLVSLMEGHVFYRSLAVNGFSTTMPIVKTGGTIAGLNGQQVELKEMVRAYNADGLARIDAGSINQDTNRHMTLAVVQGISTNGAVLVPMDAIVENGYGARGSQQLLRDGYVRQQQHSMPQPQGYNVEQVAIMRQQQLAHQQRQQQMLHVPPPPTARPVPQQQQGRGITTINDQASRDLLRKRGLLKG